MLLVLGFASDYTRLRFPFIALGFLFTFTGFVIFANVDIETELQVAYFACFMMVSYRPMTALHTCHKAYLTLLRRGEQVLLALYLVSDIS